VTRGTQGDTRKKKEDSSKKPLSESGEDSKGPGGNGHTPRIFSKDQSCWGVGRTKMELGKETGLEGGWKTEDIPSDQ